MVDFEINAWTSQTQKYSSSKYNFCSHFRIDSSVNHVHPICNDFWGFWYYRADFLMLSRWRLLCCIWALYFYSQFYIFGILPGVGSENLKKQILCKTFTATLSLHNESCWLYSGSSEKYVFSLFAGYAARFTDRILILICV